MGRCVGGLGCGLSELRLAGNGFGGGCCGQEVVPEVLNRATGLREVRREMGSRF